MKIKRSLILWVPLGAYVVFLALGGGGGKRGRLKVGKYSIIC